MADEVFVNTKEERGIKMKQATKVSTQWYRSVFGSSSLWKSLSKFRGVENEPSHRGRYSTTNISEDAERRIRLFRQRHYLE